MLTVQEHVYVSNDQENESAQESAGSRSQEVRETTGWLVLRAAGEPHHTTQPVNSEAGVAVAAPTILALQRRRMLESRRRRTPASTIQCFADGATWRQPTRRRMSGEDLASPWWLSIVISIFKKGDAKYPNNYKPISLLYRFLNTFKQTNKFFMSSPAFFGQFQCECGFVK